jgi:hypothetical protein
MNRNKFTNCLKGFALATLLAVLVFAGASNTFAGGAFGNRFSSAAYNFGPSVSTTRYGGVFVISGNGFQKGDLVTLTASTSRETESLVSEWQVWADGNGEFVTEFRADSFATPTGKFIIRAMGSESKTGVETEINLLPNPSADLDQCANGPFEAPVPCTGSNWQNGNVGQNQGHYFEGDAIPYRMRFDNLPVGVLSTVTIEWDTTQGGKHAIDYLMSYNFTEPSPGNNPCSGVTGNTSCTNNTPTTFPIPLDPNVSGQGVTQIPGQVFTMWGGTITSVTAYALSGSYAGNSSTRIQITFTPTVANPVLAWAGHIADRNDWAGLGGSASDIPGSPYHMRLIELNGSGGNQDRSLSNVAVRLNTRITIIKQANPPTTQSFAFTTTGVGLSPFNLVDNSGVTDASISFNNLLGPLSPITTYTVTEGLPVDYYVLQNITCSIAAGGTGNTSVNISTRTATLNLNYGDVATCTFVNNVVTAATTSVGGRVADSFGNPLARTLVSAYNTATGETRSVYTNQLGQYRIEDLAVGDFYVVTVSSRRYAFVNDTSSFTLDDAVEDLDFTAFAP